MTNSLTPFQSISNKLKSRLKRFLVRYVNRYACISFSQEGEDLLLRRIFENQEVGFYVDVGAHHPHRFSNTNIFYLLGWRGINIEPNPEMRSLFQRSRGKDINVQMGISNQAGHLTYYMFNEAALNTFDECLAHEYESQKYKIKNEIVIQVCRLDHLLNEVMPEGVKIDFMTIDAEGRDLNVLRSNDWERFRPRIVLVEILGFSLANVNQSEEHRYIQAQDYELIAKTVNTFFYRDTRN